MTGIFCLSYRKSATPNIGIILVQQQQLDIASIKFRQAIRFAPSFALAHYNLGVIFLNKSKALKL